MSAETLTIQQVAEMTGLSSHTLRYYERIGLIHPIQRAANGHRLYAPDDVGWIDFLNKLRATGMPIQKMQAYAELQRQGDATLAQRVEMLKSHGCEVEAHLDELNQHLNVLRYKIGIYQEILNQQQITETT